MKKERFNPIESSENIKNEYIEYMSSTFDLSDSKLYNKKFKEELNKRTLYKGPFLDITSVFKKGKSISDLVKENVLSKEFRHLKELHLDRTLYLHQDKAIRKAVDGKNVVVSTGTGSGKTESFLIPILDYLMKQKEEGNLNPGVRALLLYPMNALANDQLERLREILEDYPDITYGRYTGETEERQIKAIEKYFDYNKSNPKSNEFISREKMRETPPNILFTNYSMLEYLMIRPNDKALFKGPDSKEWKFIVLDEAHVYSGANGIEVSLLLRRLKSNFDNELQYILTSATLGKGKEDYPDIISFASKLCDAKFDVNSVISAERIENKFNTDRKYFSKKMYSELNVLDFESENEKIYSITEKYKAALPKYKNLPSGEYLYNVIKNDSNLVDLLNVTIEHTDIKEIRKQLNTYTQWNDTNLVEFINVSSKCIYNGQALFDSRYHMFIRSLEGAYVSLKPNPQIRLSRHKYIDGLRAYEIGVCKYCKSVYIIGYLDTINNKLIQNEDVDLLESYNEWEEKQVDYFLLEKNDENDSDSSEIIEYILCSKCGDIHQSNEINLDLCDCGYSYRNKIYREKPKKVNNKLKHCIACNGTSKGNIVRQFFLGKDSATSLLGQFLFNELPNISYNVKRDIIEADEFGLVTKREVINQKIETKKTKQFIAFSDSRQQAAFFAGYFDVEHDRLIRKRIILEILNKTPNLSYKAKQIVHDIQSIIEKENLFSNDENSNSINESWITLLYELLDVDRRYSLEGLGMVSFTYDLTEVDSVPNSKYFEGATLDEYKNFLEVLLNYFRQVPAVNYMDYRQLTKNYLDILDYRKYDNFVLLRKDDSKNKIGWLPVNKSNSRVEYVQKALSVDNETAKKFLEAIWNYFKTEDIICYKENRGYKIDFDRFNIISGKNSKWFICDSCQKVTTKNFKNCCPSYKCEGKLIPIDYDDIYKGNFYKKVYSTLPIENITIKEHTAQLDRDKAAKYQKDFVNEKLNILSCSTTFEMGVDVGRLETVFLRNIPPSPANYAQRAGRAGRRVDSAAYVLTYCNLSSHDYNYFEEPEKMIEGSIKPPHFVVENEKIIVRHVYAVALGEFFMEYPELYDKVDTFFNSGGIKKFINYLESKPASIEKIISRFVPKKIFNQSYKDFKWLKEISASNGYLNIINDEFFQEIREINNAMEQATNNQKYYTAGSLKKLLKTKQKERIISFLSRKNIIPKYGFPVDNVDLVTTHDSSNRLNRDLSIAISEYAPGSEVIVDKYKVTSRYIKKVEGFSLESYDYYICTECNKLNVRVHGDEVNYKCNSCGNEQEYKNTFIVPKFGFIAENSEERAQAKKPKKTYSGDVFYVGKGKPIDDLSIIYKGVEIDIQSTGNDELVIMNENPFFTCDICGYSKIDMKNSFYPSLDNVVHYNHTGYKCSNTKLTKYSLGHNFKTDVAKITFKIPIKFDNARSILYGLLEGISSYLDIERKDISGSIIKNGLYLTYDFIIFDNVPGGAGHVKRLLDKEVMINIIEETRKLMSRDCCDIETSCYTCLRNYYNQKIHDKLKRIHVKEFLDYFV